MRTIRYFILALILPTLLAPVQAGEKISGADEMGSIRFNVQPRDAEVYVDGIYRGLARDFDGTPAELRVPTGAHMITLQRDGYESWQGRTYLSTTTEVIRVVMTSRGGAPVTAATAGGGESSLIIETAYTIPTSFELFPGHTLGSGITIDLGYRFALPNTEDLAIGCWGGWTYLPTDAIRNINLFHLAAGASYILGEGQVVPVLSGAAVLYISNRVDENVPDINVGFRGSIGSEFHLRSNFSIGLVVGSYIILGRSDAGDLGFTVGLTFGFGM